MKWLNKLPNHSTVAPGLERATLKQLPALVLFGTAMPLILSTGSRFFPPQGTPEEVAAYFTQLDILALASAVIIWMTALTIAIVCAFVVLLKGPAYVADAYPLRESEQPLR